MLFSLHTSIRSWWSKKSGPIYYNISGRPNTPLLARFGPRGAKSAKNALLVRDNSGKMAKFLNFGKKKRKINAAPHSGEHTLG